MTTKPFGWWLAHHRSAARLSQTQLAKKCGYDHSTISRLESGSRHPSREMVDRLVNELDLDLYDRTRFIAAAGFMPAGSSVVTRPLLVDLDVLLNDDRTGPIVKTVVLDQLKSLRRLLEATIDEGRPAA
ncbi:MAG: helix-turn-helix transcriptional regulator [Rhodanobacteraceae bacterium]|nr:helix-turn-helix transcriptional regulator [Rhodanobacteraceae bacterium]